MASTFCLWNTEKNGCANVKKATEKNAVGMPNITQNYDWFSMANTIDYKYSFHSFFRVNVGEKKTRLNNTKMQFGLADTCVETEQATSCLLVPVAHKCDVTFAFLPPDGAWNGSNFFTPFFTGYVLMITIGWHRGALTERAYYVCVCDCVLGIGSQYYNNDTHTHVSGGKQKKLFYGPLSMRAQDGIHRRRTTKVTVAVMTAAAAAVSVAAVGQKMHVFVNNGPSPARFKIKARQNKSN